MIAFAVVGNFVVLTGLVTPGDAAQTATDIGNAEGTFRLGITSLFAVAVLDVIVAWGLYVVFAPVSRRLSMLAAWFRVVYAGVFTVAISQLVGVLGLLNAPDALAAFTTQQRQALALQRIETFNEVWSAGLILFGGHLLVIGYLAYRADYVPTFLAGLLGIAGLGYVVDGVGNVLLAGYGLEVSMVTFVGEVVLIGWLLLRGRRVSVDGEDTSLAT